MANLDDYREVPERIHEWYVRHPEGRIVCTVLHEPSEDRPWWTVKASCYRTQEPLEEPSGVGHSFLEVPGKTNFTRGSELENAETSAAGRALVMAGIPASRVSSGHEVSMKGGDEGSSSTWGGGGTGGEATGPTSSPQPDEKLNARSATALKDLFPTSKAALEMASKVLERDVTSLRDITNAEGSKVVEALAEERKLASSGAGYGDG